MTTPHNIDTPNWEPLESAVLAAGLPLETCSEFMWMGEWRIGEHSYKHIRTRGYVVLGSSIDAGAAGRVRKARCGWCHGALAVRP